MYIFSWMITLTTWKYLIWFSIYLQIYTNNLSNSIKLIVRTTTIILTIYIYLIILSTYLSIITIYLFSWLLRLQRRWLSWPYVSICLSIYISILTSNPLFIQLIVQCRIQIRWLPWPYVSIWISTYLSSYNNNISIQRIVETTTKMTTLTIRIYLIVYLYLPRTLK